MCLRGVLTLSLVSIAMLLVCQSCVAVQGSCEVDGKSINTYQLIGKWKQVTGYDPQRTKAELESNFNLLVIQKGTTLCAIPVIQQAPQSTTEYTATYEDDINLKKVTFHYTAGPDANNSETSNYSFSGSCDSTTLTWTRGGNIETFRLINQDVSTNPCGP